MTLNPKSILIVDDESHILHSITEALATTEYKLVVTTQYQEAIDLSQNQSFSLALIDINMGAHNGIELLSEIKKIQPYLLCVMMTAHATMESAIGALKHGAYDYLRKPFTSSELLNAIGRYFSWLELQEERHKAEQELQLFEELINHSNDLILVVDTVSGQNLYVNQKISQALEFTREEILSLQMIDLLNGNPYALSWQELLTIFAKDKRGVFEVQMRRKSGSSFAVEMNVKQVVENNISCILAVCRDISERQRATSLLLDERKKLEREVEARTHELRTSLMEIEATHNILQETYNHKNRFLSSLSHELRTPLQAILGYCDLLQGQYYGKLNDKQTNYSEQINKSGKHLLSLLNGMLDLARIEAGEMSIQIESFNVVNLIVECYKMVENQAANKKQTIQLKLPEEVLYMSADKIKIKQVLLNLLTNAIKYTPVNGLITVALVIEKDQTIKIVVEDTGMGIEPEDQDKIFTEFYQANRVREEHLGGAGIGLALARRLIDMHEGEMGFTSTPGKGSSFWFKLPMAKSESKDSLFNNTTHFNLRARKRHRILVVEDNITNLNMILDMLAVANHYVSVARNGEEAIASVEKEKPDLILMDLQMPVMNGFEATQALRQNPEYRSIPIVAVTASADETAIKQCFASGFTDYLAKPVKLKVLLETIQRLMSSPHTH